MSEQFRPMKMCPKSKSEHQWLDSDKLIRQGMQDSNRE
jgi:hypothetical protein